MNILAWVIFGLIVGVIANMIDSRPQEGGLLGVVALGVVGSLVGGFVGNLIFGVGITGFDFGSFIVAIIGSLILLWLGRAVRKV